MVDLDVFLDLAPPFDLQRLEEGLDRVPLIPLVLAKVEIDLEADFGIRLQ